MNYVVQPGDTLNAIAARFGVPIQELIRVNNLTAPYILYVGQNLFIPTRRPGGAPGPAPAPAPGPTRPTPGTVDRRLDRLENRVDRLERQIVNLDNRLDRLERRPRTTP